MSTTNPTRITSQWDDIHRRLGNYAPLEEIITNEEITQKNVEIAESIDPSEKLTPKQVEQLEDLNIQDQDNSIDEVLNFYRKKRLEELKKRQSSHRFGYVKHIGKADFTQEITEASKSPSSSPSSHPSSSSQDPPNAAGRNKQKVPDGTWVVTHVYSDALLFCKKMNSVLEEVSQRHGSVKFVKGKIEDILPNFPSKNLPLILIYKGGVCLSQIMGTYIWDNLNINAEIVEYVLSTYFGLWETDIQEDPRSENSRSVGKPNSDKPFNPDSFYGLKGRPREDDEDDDDDEDEDDRGYSSMNIDKKKSLIRLL